MHLCYADDSASDKARSITGLTVPADQWVDLTSRWLAGRQKLADRWGVRKDVELHANVLLRPGAGRFCHTADQEEVFRGLDAG